MIAGCSQKHHVRHRTITIKETTVISIDEIPVVRKQGKKDVKSSFNNLEAKHIRQEARKSFDELQKKIKQ